jgi:gliding motility-associated-like protein
MVFAQPNDCNEAVPGCSLPSFQIQTSNPATNIMDFGTGTFSNPSNNPNAIPGNSGCLLTGEISSTFITISVVSTGTLAWSMQGSNGGCFDWIMWPYLNSTTTCSAILGGSLSPVACNWNSPCQGFTGMAPAGGLPAGASQGNFERALNVVAGDIFLLCLSNFSGTIQNVDLNFFGTANVSCRVSAPDQNICQGGSALVNIATPGYLNPVFTWLTTTGVSNTSLGSNVSVAPLVTTTYKVRVVQPPTLNTIQIVDTAEFTIFVETPPTPFAGMDDTVCFGTPITLSGNVTSLSNTRSWGYFNVGVSPAPTVQFSPNFGVLNPTIIVSQPGLYGFVLKETNALCGLKRDTVFVYAKKMTAISTFTEPSCVGFSDAGITISGPDANSFSFDNGLSWSANSTMAGLSAGQYDVCVSDHDACLACFQVDITDPSAVSMRVSSDTTICENGTASLLALAEGGTNFEYVWSHTNNSSPLVQATTLASRYFNVFAKNQNGCETDLDSIFVEVLDGIQVDFADVEAVCPGFEASVFAEAIGGNSNYTFSWSDGTVTSGPTSTMRTRPTSSQTVTVVVRDGCESTAITAQAQMNVSALPVPSFKAEFNQLCEPARFDLVVESDPSTYEEASFFISDGEFYGNATEISTNEMSSGAYDVQLVLRNAAGCVDSLTFEDYLVSVPKPVANFKFYPERPTSFNTGVNFTNFSLEGETYDWDFGAANPGTSTEKSPAVLFPDGQDGAYEVFMIATSSFGCRDTAVAVVNVFPEVVIYAPNAFTPDFNNYNQNWFVQLQGIETSDYNVQVFDRWGGKVWESNDVDGRWDGTINGDILPAGIYTYVIKTSDRISGENYDFNGTISLLK